MRGRETVLIKQVEHVPLPDPVSIIAPSIIACCLGRRRGRAVASQPAEEAEDFDVIANTNSQTLVSRPREVGPIGQWAIVISVVFVELCEWHRVLLVRSQSLAERLSQPAGLGLVLASSAVLSRMMNLLTSARCGVHREQKKQKFVLRSAL